MRNKTHIFSESKSKSKGSFFAPTIPIQTDGLDNTNFFQGKMIISRANSHSNGLIQKWDPGPPPMYDYGYSESVPSARRSQTHERFRTFIRAVSRHGLPVRFLEAVERAYSISTGSSDQVNTFFNTMTLEPETLSSVDNLSPGLPIGESSGIHTIFHEATHAIFDLRSGDPRYSGIISAGERHYRNAPLSNRQAATDPSRIFQEAAAGYVAHRAASWWAALETLSILAASTRTGPMVQEMLDRTIARYDRDMGERVFGYQDTGGFLGFGSVQTETTRPMSQGLKTFLDQELLENRIPETFAEVGAFMVLVRRIRGRLGTSASGSSTSP